MKCIALRHCNCSKYNGNDRSFKRSVLLLIVASNSTFPIFFFTAAVITVVVYIGQFAKSTYKYNYTRWFTRATKVQTLVQMQMQNTFTRRTQTQLRKVRYAGAVEVFFPRWRTRLWLWP